MESGDYITKLSGGLGFLWPDVIGSLVLDFPSPTLVRTVDTVGESHIFPVHLVTGYSERSK